MVAKNIYNNTPVRNKNVGLPDPQANNGQATVSSTPPPIVDNTAPAQKVVEMAQKSYALRHGGQLPQNGITTTETEPPMGADNQGGNPVVRHPNGDVANMNFFDGSNSAIGKYENLQPRQTNNGLITDFTNMPKQNDFVPQTGNGYANPTVGPTQSPYMVDAAETTQQPQSSFEGMQPQNNNGWNPQAETSDVGYKGAPYAPSSYNSLSAALNGEIPSSSQVPAFQKDDTKKDGGFFNWLKGLMPKSRPGKREGESDDDYDRRTTKNMQMVATLADAIRHMGNIVNTSKGAPLQAFNDPSTMLETGYQNRKAQRQKQDALDRDAAQKQNEMTLKQQAAEADRNYKALTLNLKQQAADRAADKDKFDREYKAAGLKRQLDNDAFSHDLAGKKFDEQKRHNGVSEQQGAARIALSQERNGIARARLAYTIANGDGSGSGSGKSSVNLSSPSGHLNRGKELSTVEKKQITQYLIKNGYINKKNLDAYNDYIRMGDTKNVGDLQNYWIAYAANMPGKKGDVFRTTLKNHYMYKESSTTETPKSKSGNGSVVTVTQKGNKGGKGGKGGSTTTQKPSTAAKKKFHVD